MFNLLTPLKQLFDQYILHPRTRYYLAAKLEEHRGAIGCLAFDERCRILVSRGDDEVVKIWNLQTYECIQTLADQESQWGQITTICFVGAANGHNSYLCFGTGRGRLIVYQRNRMGALFTQISNDAIFTNWDCVESIAFNPTKQRLLAKSQSGKIKLFGFCDGRFVEQWERAMRDAIAKAAHFLNNGGSVQVFGLETGEIASFDTDTAEPISVRLLKTRIGDVSMCERSGNILVDNLGFGFDLYAPNRAHPVRSYPVPAKRRFVKQAAFAEMGTSVVCGSDHGVVYIYGIDGAKAIQKLVHSRGDDRVPVIEAGRSETGFLIATGSRGKKNGVHIWKKTASTVPRAQASSSVNLLLLLNIALIITLGWYSADAWMPAVQMHTHRVSAVYNGMMIKAVETLGQAPRWNPSTEMVKEAPRWSPEAEMVKEASQWDSGMELFDINDNDNEWDEGDLDSL
ncbi:WD40-repeat-containing domain protein [Panaeolus papilionaceus]|nr:WD40-repeat-containing domain protein [Panaeolus papilionaceus]